LDRRRAPRRALGDAPGRAAGRDCARARAVNLSALAAVPAARPRT
jgi:hypothetical protein